MFSLFLRRQTVEEDENDGFFLEKEDWKNEEWRLINCDASKPPKCRRFFYK